MIIVGKDIMNYFPFTELNEDRSQEWTGNVKGWGEVKVSSVNGEDSCTVIPTKKDMYGVYEFSHTHRGVVRNYRYIGWIDEFIQIYGEEPIFRINPDGAWYEKIEVLNEKFIKRRKEYSDSKMAGIEALGTTE